MRVLVAGDREVDAGKTTFTRGLIPALGARAVKPRAASDHWYDYDECCTGLRDGRLFGKDARLLATAQSAETTPESINPIHRLWQPTSAPGAIHEVPHREFLVDRVGDTYVVNGTADLPAPLHEHLPLDGARSVASLAEMNDVVRELHLPALNRFAEEVRQEVSLVIESYGDIATPLPSVACDIAAVVEPRRVRYFDGERYGKSCEVASRTPRAGSMESVVENVIAELEPLASAPLPPLETDERADPARIANAYREAYEQLVALPEATTAGR